MYYPLQSRTIARTNPPLIDRMNAVRPGARRRAEAEAEAEGQGGGSVGRATDGMEGGGSEARTDLISSYSLLNISIVIR